MDRLKEIIQQVKSFGVRGLIFTGGGEPLCNPATLEAVEYAKSLGLDVGFITNGSLLSQEACVTILENCIWVRISLDACDADIFKQTHGLDGKEFDKVVSNIAKIVEIKRKIKSDTTVGIGYLTFDNEKVINGIVPFAKLGKSLDVDYVQYRPLLRRFLEREFNYEINRKVLDEIEAAVKFSEPGYDVLYSGHKYEDMKNGTIHRSYEKCFGHHFATTISTDEKMYLCCHMRGVEKYCIGDLKKNSLEEIWRSEHRSNVYESIDFQDCPLLCRCNTFNEILWNVVLEKKHKNFI